MSDNVIGEEEHSSSSSSIQLSAEEVPIPALPADVQEEDSLDASLRRAFQNLQEAHAAGKIDSTKVAEIKAKFIQLKDAVKRSQESEKQHHREAEILMAEVGQQRKFLRKREKGQASSTTKASELRRQLLVIEKQTCEVEEQDSQLQFQLQSLREEKEILEKAYNAQPKPADLERKASELKESCDEMRQDIFQRQKELQKRREVSDSMQRNLRKERAELDIKKNTIKNLETELAQLRSVPDQLGNETDRVKKKIADVQTRRAELGQQLAELSSRHEELLTCVEALEQTHKKDVAEQERRKAELEAAVAEHDALLKAGAVFREKRNLLMAEKSMLDDKIDRINLEKKTFHKNLMMNEKEIDQLQPNLKLMETKLKMAADSLANTQFQFNKIKARRDAMPPRDEALPKINELKEEVEELRRNWLRKQHLTEVEKQTVEQNQEEERELQKEIDHWREELHRLTSLRQIEAAKMEECHHKLLAARQRLSRANEELKIKDMTLLDQKNLFHEAKHRLSAFTELNDVMQKKRDECVSLIQIASERSSKICEEHDVLKNSMETMRNKVINKDKELKEVRKKLKHSEIVRNTLKRNISKTAQELHEMEDKSSAQKLEISKLTSTLTFKKESLLQLHNSYNDAMRSCDDLGVQVQEIEGEICVLSERVKVQEGLIAEGDAEIQAMEEAMGSLVMLRNEINRELELSKRYQEGKISALQAKQSEINDQRLALEKAMEDQLSRVPRLVGSDPPTDQLVKKIEMLEKNLAEQDAKLLEKELVTNQVTQLSQSICAKAEDAYRDTLDTAKKVNEQRRQLKETDEKLMAAVAELAMEQAVAQKLQQEIRDKEELLESYQQQLTQGVSPGQNTCAPENDSSSSPGRTEP